MLATDERFAELARLINEASTCTENCVIEYKVQPHSKEHDRELYIKIFLDCFLSIRSEQKGLRRTSWTVHGAGVSGQCWKDLELAAWEPGPNYPLQPLLLRLRLGRDYKRGVHGHARHLPQMA